jgi:hypothetical protein
LVVVALASVKASARVLAKALAKALPTVSVFPSP